MFNSFDCVIHPILCQRRFLITFHHEATHIRCYSSNRVAKSQHTQEKRKERNAISWQRNRNKEFLYLRRKLHVVCDHKRKQSMMAKETISSKCIARPNIQIFSSLLLLFHFSFILIVIRYSIIFSPLFGAFFIHIAKMKRRKKISLTLCITIFHVNHILRIKAKKILDWPKTNVHISRNMNSNNSNCFPLSCLFVRCFFFRWFRDKIGNDAENVEKWNDINMNIKSLMWFSIWIVVFCMQCTITDTQHHTNTDVGWDTVFEMQSTACHNVNQFFKKKAKKNLNGSSQIYIEMSWNHFHYDICADIILFSACNFHSPLECAWKCVPITDYYVSIIWISSSVYHLTWGHVSYLIVIIQWNRLCQLYNEVISQKSLKLKRFPLFSESSPLRRW